MGRRITIHLLALVGGLALGLLIAQVLVNNEYSGLAVATAVAASIFGSQVVANGIFEGKQEAKAAEPPPPAEPIFRGREVWGWLQPDNKRSGFPLARERIRIGRGVEMDIMLNNSSISRLHAELWQLRDGFLIKDAGSRNGVFVNGKRIQEELLKHGDSVWLGEMRFKFTLMPERTELMDRLGDRRQASATRRDGPERREQTDRREIAEQQVSPISPTQDLSPRPFEETTDYTPPDAP